MGCEARKRSSSPGPSPVECSKWTLYTFPKPLVRLRRQLGITPLSLFLERPLLAGRFLPYPRLDRNAKLQCSTGMPTPTGIGIGRYPRSDPKPLQDLDFFDSTLIGFFPAAFSFAFNAGSPVVFSASHFCSDASS